MNKDLISVGKIVKTHGIKGDLIAFFYSDDFNSLKKYKKFYTKKGQIIDLNFKSKPSYHLADDRNNSYIKIIVNIKEEKDINNVLGLIGNEVFVEKSEVELKKDEFLISDLIGLDVCKFQDRDFKIGIVKDIHDFGAGTILEIDSDIRQFQIFNMMNFDNDSFPEIDLENRRIYLNIDLSEISDLEDGESEISDQSVIAVGNSWNNFLKNKKN